MSDSYYELIDDSDPRGERFRATDMVRGTWSATIQHAAPVSALLVRALERCAQREDTRCSRVVIDLMGGVPSEGDLWVTARMERPGRQIELLVAEMLAAGPDAAPRTVARASAWRMLQVDTVQLVNAPVAALPPVERARSHDMARNWEPNYVHSIDWRWLTVPQADGPGESWLRPTVDLVKGETMTPLQRLFAVADDANGIGSKIDIRNWTFLNTDLVVHVHRVPDGEWIGIRADTCYGPDGIGTTVGTLFDQTGPVGAIQQSVLVRARPSR